jgi:lipoate-protein ligase A
VRWRLLDTGPGRGPWNLALDEAVFESVRAGASPPTLRFYAWSHPVLSIGYAQDRGRDVDEEACRRLGVPVVRRVTGGRAVLHDPEREVTYSVAAPHDPALFGAGLASAARCVAGGLVAGLRRLGIEASGAGARRAAAPGRSPACFASAARHEIVAGGRKVVGSAQRRVGGAFLQQGSVLLEARAAALAALLRGASGGREEGAMTGIAELAGRSLAYAEVVAALAAGFEEAWGVRLNPGGTSVAEGRAAVRLERGRYGDAAWNAGLARLGTEAPRRRAATR